MHRSGTPLPTSHGSVVTTPRIDILNPYPGGNRTIGEKHAARYIRRHDARMTEGGQLEFLRDTRIARPTKPGAKRVVHNSALVVVDVTPPVDGSIHGTDWWACIPRYGEPEN